MAFLMNYSLFLFWLHGLIGNGQALPGHILIPVLELIVGLAL
jgi:hypothetical protein